MIRRSSYCWKRLSLRITTTMQADTLTSKNSQRCLKPVTLSKIHKGRFLRHWFVSLPWNWSNLINISDGFNHSLGCSCRDEHSWATGHFPTKWSDAKGRNKVGVGSHQSALVPRIYSQGTQCMEPIFTYIFYIYHLAPKTSQMQVKNRSWIFRPAGTVGKPMFFVTKGSKSKGPQSSN